MNVRNLLCVNMNYTNGIICLGTFTTYRYLYIYAGNIIRFETEEVPLFSMNVKKKKTGRLNDFGAIYEPMKPCLMPSFITPQVEG